MRRLRSLLAVAMFLCGAGGLLAPSGPSDTKRYDIAEPQRGVAEATCPCDNDCPFQEVATTAQAIPGAIAPPATAGTTQERPLDYGTALAEHQANHQPLAVLVGSATCGPCKAAKERLKHVRGPRAYLEWERDETLIRKLLACVPESFDTSRVPFVVVFGAKRNQGIDHTGVSRWIEEQSR